jgi:hypothetical protein
LKPLIHIQDPGKASGYYDRCIGSSPNGLACALSWYLNIVAPDWELLVTDDRTSVMPLPLVKSFKRKVLRQPDFTWQLGVFSSKIPSPELVRHFLDSVPREYRLKKLCLNKYNALPAGQARYLNSTELDLIRPYRILSRQYGPSMKESLNRAKQDSLSYLGNISVHDMLMFAYRLDRFNRTRPRPRDITLLRMISTNAIRYRTGQIGAAYDVHNNLVATIFFMVFNGRANILHASASSEGLKSGGIEFILDRFIRSRSEENMVLCIDNPDEKKLMEILKSCGAGLSNYPCLKYLRVN